MAEKPKAAKHSAKSESKSAPAKASAPKPTVKITKGDTGGNKAIVTRKLRTEAAPAIKAATAKGKPLPVLPTSERAGLVARAAYFIAERRNFSVGNDLADWLEAERQVDESYVFV